MIVSLTVGRNSFRVAVAAATLGLACGASGPDDVAGAEDALAAASLRRAVYDQVQGGMAAAEYGAHAPEDLLRPEQTDERLVAAIGWLMAHDAPSFYLSSINSDHHPDGQAGHSGGHAADMFAKDGNQARRLVQLITQNPYVAEVGLGGAYKAYRSNIANRSYFDDNDQTHVHVGVIQAFGRCIGTCSPVGPVVDGGIDVPDTDASTPPRGPGPGTGIPADADCTSKSNGWYCSHSDESAAYFCQSSQPVDTWFCAEDSACRPNANGQATLFQGHTPGCFARP